MILDWARLLSVPKVFCWCLILLLSWLAITENLKNWPDLASLAALVFSLTLCTLFFSPVLHLSFTKFKCSWVGGPLWTSWSNERKCKCKFIILIQILFPSYYGSTRNCWCDFLSAITHHSAEHERMAQTEDTRQHPWPGSLLVIDIWLRINPSPSSLIWQLRIFLHQSCMASNSSTVQRWNWGIFTKQNWEAGWKSSSRSNGRIHIF